MKISKQEIAKIIKSVIKEQADPEQSNYQMLITTEAALPSHIFDLMNQGGSEEDVFNEIRRLDDVDTSFAYEIYELPARRGDSDAKYIDQFRAMAEADNWDTDQLGEGTIAIIKDADNNYYYLPYF